jgi:hypothetical protein
MFRSMQIGKLIEKKSELEAAILALIERFEDESERRVINVGLVTVIADGGAIKTIINIGLAS